MFVEYFEKRVAESPNSEEKENADPAYIRSLLTRAKISRGLSRELVAKRCGISKSALDRYISYGQNSTTCPYPIQYTLESLVGINDRGGLYEVSLEVPKEHLQELKKFDDFICFYSDLAVRTRERVRITLALEKDEIKEVKKSFEKHASDVEIQPLSEKLSS